MNEFVRWPKLYLLLSATCDETVMDDWDLDAKSLSKWQQFQHCKSIILKKIYKKWQIMLGQHLVLVTLYHGLQLVLSKAIRIGDTKYHI